MDTYLVKHPSYFLHIFFLLAKAGFSTLRIRYFKISSDIDGEDMMSPIIVLFEEI